MNNEEAICAKSKKVTEKCTLRDDSFKYKIIRTALVCWSFFALVRKVYFLLSLLDVSYFPVDDLLGLNLSLVNEKS